MASEGLHETRSNEINFKSLSLSIFLWSYSEKHLGVSHCSITNVKSDLSFILQK